MVESIPQRPKLALCLALMVRLRVRAVPNIIPLFNLQSEIENLKSSYNVPIAFIDLEDS